MHLINISIAQEEVNRHLSTPIADHVSYSIVSKVMPALHWYKISSLGFGSEGDKGEKNAESEGKGLDYAASLFAACGRSFSILCERKDRGIVYAIGCQDKGLAPRLLKSTFGTVKSEEYNPQFPDDNGLYAHNFEVVRVNAEELDKRESFSAIHMSRWADSIAKVLTQ